MPAPEVPGIATGLVLLGAAVERLLAAARTLPDLDVLTTGEWSARMVLMHVTFWHESFARNVAGLAPEGSRTRSVARTRRSPGGRAWSSAISTWMRSSRTSRLATAHAMVSRDIAASGIELIPYRHGRLHTPPEVLRITVGHVDHHASELEQGSR